jgi:hypothetical protein
MKESELPIAYANAVKIMDIPSPVAEWDDPCYRSSIIVPNDGLCRICNVCNYFIPDEAPKNIEAFIEYYKNLTNYNK